MCLCLGVCLCASPSSLSLSLSLFLSLSLSRCSGFAYQSIPQGNAAHNVMEEDFEGDDVAPAGKGRDDQEEEEVDDKVAEGEGEKRVVLVVDTNDRVVVEVA